MSRLTDGRLLGELVDDFAAVGVFSFRAELEGRFEDPFDAAEVPHAFFNLFEAFLY